MPRGETSIGGHQEEFPQTIGSLLMTAKNPEALNHKAALNRLFLLYWRPIYAFIRKHGYTVEDAKDLTQDFMLELFERGLLQRFDPARGRFRSYLKGAIKLAVAEDRRSRARKSRGGGYVIHPLNLSELENAQFASELEKYSPEEMFDRQLADEVLARSLRTVRRDLEADGKKGYFEVYDAYELHPGSERPSYESVAKELGITADRVRKRLEYVRAKLEKVITETVAEYSSTHQEAADERAQISLQSRVGKPKSAS